MNCVHDQFHKMLKVVDKLEHPQLNFFDKEQNVQHGILQLVQSLLVSWILCNKLCKLSNCLQRVETSRYFGLEFDQVLINGFGSRQYDSNLLLCFLYTRIPRQKHLNLD